jgi:acylphosphatase
MRKQDRPGNPGGPPEAGGGDGSAKNVRLRARCFGRVQGVGFRDFCRRAALDLGVSGWVRNLPDGSVELEAEAPPRVLKTFFTRIKEGHPWARVDRMETASASAGGPSEGFEITW